MTFLHEQSDFGDLLAVVGDTLKIDPGSSTPRAASGAQRLERGPTGEAQSSPPAIDRALTLKVPGDTVR